MSSFCNPDVVALKRVVHEVEQLLEIASELIDKVDKATEQLGFDSSSRSSKATATPEAILRKKKKGPPDTPRDRSRYFFRRTSVHNYKDTRNYVRLSGEKRKNQDINDFVPVVGDLV